MRYYFQKLAVKLITVFFEGPKLDFSKCTKQPENGFATANAQL